MEIITAQERLEILRRREDTKLERFLTQINRELLAMKRAVTIPFPDYLDDEKKIAIVNALQNVGYNANLEMNRDDLEFTHLNILLKM